MDFSGLLGFLGDAIDAQISSVIVWSTAQFGVLTSDVLSLNGVLGDLTTYLGKIFGELWTFLKQLGDWINRNLIQRLAQLIQRIHDWLKRIFGPLLDTIHAYQKLLRDLWMQYVKPIYDFLQRLRSALVLFRLLGFKWAQRLDARIVKLETALTNAFFAVYTNLNTLANWINYLIDPFGLFQPDVWLRSIAQSIGAIIGIANQQMSDPGFTDSPGAYSTPDGYYQADTMTARVRQRGQIGLLPEDQAVLDSLRANATELGYSR